MSDYVITTDGLTKVYQKTRALDGLKLRVPQGSVYGFLGRNGAGKTTTIRILGGLARCTSGEARVLGLTPGRDQIGILQRTAFVGEQKALYENLTPAELVRFTRSFYQGWSDTAAERCARRLDIPMSQKVRKLSKGNRTKVALLLALAQGAELLVLDEPSTALDPVVVDEFLAILMEEHTAEGRTVFFSSHQLSEVEQVCDWVGVIDRGRLLLEARLDDIRTDYRIVTAAGRDLPAGSDTVLATTTSGKFTRYLISSAAGEFTAGLERNGAAVSDVSAVTLRDVFLMLLRKEEPCITGNVGETRVEASSSI